MSGIDDHHPVVPEGQRFRRCGSCGGPWPCPALLRLLGRVEPLTLDGKCPRCGETPEVERHEWTGHVESLVCVECEIVWSSDGKRGVEA